MVNIKLAAMAVLLIGKKPVRRTALNKLWFFADLAHFLEFGKTISGERYLCMDYGPLPDSAHLVRTSIVHWGYVQEHAEDKGELRYFSYTRNKGTPLKQVEKSLEATELATVKRVAAELGRKSAPFLSELSHRFEPGKSAHAGDVLDLGRAKNDADLQHWLASRGLAGLGKAA